MEKPENAEIVGTICDQFPHVLVRLVRALLLKQVTKQCKDKLGTNREWRVDPYEVGEQSSKRENYPGIELSPTKLDGLPHWSFYLELEGVKLPMKFCHGLIFTEKGGQPKKMSKAVAKELGVMKTLLKGESLNIRCSPSSMWFANSLAPYAPYTLGDKPEVVSEIHDGMLASKITSEFMTLFENYWEDLSHLNAALNAR